MKFSQVMEHNVNNIFSSKIKQGDQFQISFRLFKEALYELKATG